MEQGSLTPSSSVAEGVLTPAALHLRAAAGETGRGREGGMLMVVLEHGPRCHRLHFNQVMESPPAATSYIPQKWAACVLLQEAPARRLGLIKGGAGQRCSCSLFPPLEWGKGSFTGRAVIVVKGFILQNHIFVHFRTSKEKKSIWTDKIAKSSHFGPLHLQQRDLQQKGHHLRWLFCILKDGESNNPNCLLFRSCNPVI